MNLHTSNTKEYKTINGCTKQFECEQVFWALGMTAIVSVYSVFTVPPIIRWNSVPLIIFMAIAYFLCLLMTYDYLKLTITDPVDERIKGIRFEGETKYCSRCQISIGVKTYHCVKCKRCTDELDHHSTLVNNCISLKNLTNYLRLNICYLIITTIIAIESLLVFAYSFDDSELKGYFINRWVAAFIGVVSGIVMPIGLFNLISSLYIRFVRNQPKVEYYYREKGSNHSEIQSSEKLGSGESVRAQNL